MIPPSMGTALRMVFPSPIYALLTSNKNAALGSSLNQLNPAASLAVFLSSVSGMSRVL